MRASERRMREASCRLFGVMKLPMLCVYVLLVLRSEAQPFASFVRCLIQLDAAHCPSASEALMTAILPHTALSGTVNMLRWAPAQHAHLRVPCPARSRMPAEQKPYTTPPGFKAPSLSEQWAYANRCARPSWALRPPKHALDCPSSQGFDGCCRKYPVARFGVPAACLIGLLAFALSPAKGAQPKRSTES